MAEPSPPPSGPTRRRFLFQIGVASLAAVVGEAAWATVRFARAPLSYGPPLKHLLGRLSDFARGGTTYVEDAKVFVKRDDEGVRALSAVCTHLGCTVRRAEDGFVCPCHGSQYDHDGHVTGGPAPADLAQYELTLDAAGRLTVDLGRPVDRGTHLRAHGES